ncbi:MAG: helix-turn-helix transcriptional regulator [Nitrospirota bacterium]
MIRFQGRMWQDGKFWLIEVPLFDAMTQGKSRKDALNMIKDYFECLLDQKEVHVFVESIDDQILELWSDPIAPLFALLLQRQRQISGLSLAETAIRLGSRSPNTYGRYEQGKSVPSIEKFFELLDAVTPDKHWVLT